MAKKNTWLQELNGLQRKGRVSGSGKRVAIEGLSTRVGEKNSSQREERQWWGRSAAVEGTALVSLRQSQERKLSCSRGSWGRAPGLIAELQIGD